MVPEPLDTKEGFVQSVQSPAGEGAGRRKTKLKGTRVTQGIDDLGHKLRSSSLRTILQIRLTLTRYLSIRRGGRPSLGVDPEEDITLGGDCRHQRAWVSQTPAQHTTTCKMLSRASWADIDEEL